MSFIEKIMKLNERKLSDEEICEVLEIDEYELSQAENYIYEHFCDDMNFID